MQSNILCAEVELCLLTPSISVVTVQHTCAAPQTPALSKEANVPQLLQDTGQAMAIA